MSSRPEIKLRGWITVEGTDCVVTAVRPEGDQLGDCEVVFNPIKPTSHDVEWSEGKWRFADRPDYGGYAERSDRLKPYVTILKQGRK